jgi:hypothetical protein
MYRRLFLQRLIVRTMPELSDRVSAVGMGLSVLFILSDEGAWLTVQRTPAAINQVLVVYSAA